jgi:hypothetical protein
MSDGHQTPCQRYSITPSLPCNDFFMHFPTSSLLIFQLFCHSCILGKQLTLSDYSVSSRFGSWRISNEQRSWCHLDQLPSLQLWIRYIQSDLKFWVSNLPSVCLFSVVGTVLFAVVSTLFVRLRQLIRSQSTYLLEPP